MHPHVHCSVTYSSQDIEATQVPISRWVDKKAVLHVHDGILFSHKKEQNLTSCGSIDEPRGHCAKWNKSDREW